MFGKWKGLVWPQSVADVPVEIKVHFIFSEVTGKVFKGEMHFTSWTERGIICNELIGGFRSENDLIFTYEKKQDGIVGWGEIILELSPDGRSLVGNVIGVSSHTGEHFNSKLHLIKGTASELKQFSILRPKTPKIFIGHGRNSAWKQLSSFLRKKHYIVEAFEASPRAGKAISDVLDGMVRDTSFACLVMTGEDKTAAGELRARQNVVHELGLFQGKLGPHRAIVLLEKGVEKFSNMSGTTYISFKKGEIAKVFGKVLKTIRREFPDTPRK